MTPAQRNVLAFIHARTFEAGIPPSFAEMQQHMEWRSKSGVARVLSALEERGYIARMRYRAREVHLTPMGLAALAGRPAPAPSDILDALEAMLRLWKAIGMPDRALRVAGPPERIVTSAEARRTLIQYRPHLAQEFA